MVRMFHDWFLFNSSFQNRNGNTGMTGNSVHVGRFKFRGTHLLAIIVAVTPGSVVV